MVETRTPRTLTAADPVRRLVHRAPVDEMAPIGEAVAEMLRNEIRHLAVTRDDQTVGLISMRDLLAVLAAEAR
jgi:signal-transduction protein with cAMP-binding, CBS, and nucleotidyltransferase domain